MKTAEWVERVTTLEVRIQKFETQYRLPPWARAEQRRLDQVKPIALENAFETALRHVAMREEAELCLRNLFVSVHLNLRDSDQSISAVWSKATAQEIARALRDGSTKNVVLYQSRRQALLDLALSVARGDLSRAWAWRQLGLWRSSNADESEAIAELVGTLRGAPAMVVPALRALARAGWLHGVVTRLTATQWKDLAWAALSEAGAVHVLELAGGEPSSRALRDAYRVLRVSLLLPAITRARPSGATGATRRAIAALAVMDADPSLLRTETAQTLVGIIADAITNSVNPAINEIVADSPDAQARPDREFEKADVTNRPAFSSANSTEIDAKGSATRNDPNAAYSSETDRSDLTGQGGNQKPSDAALTSASRVAKPATTRRTAPTPEAKRNSDVDTDLDSVGKRNEGNRNEGNRNEGKLNEGKLNEEETELLDLQRRALTRFGGLLFLIAVLDDLELPEQIIKQELLGVRPFAWVIHQLALALAPIEPNDPAALAFAGLSPDAEPPPEGEAPPSESEAQALSALAAQIVARLGSLLEREDQPEGSVLDFVCCRRGEIVADPGWIEVRLSLDDVVTDIRRAGLDLNPGYVPWLGVVVVFVYE